LIIKLIYYVISVDYIILILLGKLVTKQTVGTTTTNARNLFTK